MKKIIFLISLLFVFSLFAQEVQPAENEPAEKAEEKLEENAEAAQPQEESAPAKADDDKITVSKEELAKLVREAVAEEMAKKEAEKKEAEAAKEQEVAANTEKAEEKPAEEGEKAEEVKEEPSKTSDSNGLIQTSYTKSSIAFIMGDDNLRDNSQYSPKWDIGSRYEYEDFADRVYGYSNNIKSSTKLSLFHEEKGFVPYLTARMSLSFAMYNSVDAMSDKLITSLKEDRSFLEIDFRHPTKHRFNITF